MPGGRGGVQSGFQPQRHENPVVNLPGLLAFPSLRLLSLAASRNSSMGWVCPGLLIRHFVSIAEESMR